MISVPKINCELHYISMASCPPNLTFSQDTHTSQGNLKLNHHDTSPLFVPTQIVKTKYLEFLVQLIESELDTVIFPNSDAIF